MVTSWIAVTERVFPLEDCDIELYDAYHKMWMADLNYPARVFSIYSMVHRLEYKLGRPHYQARIHDHRADHFNCEYCQDPEEKFDLFLPGCGTHFDPDGYMDAETIVEDDPWMEDRLCRK